MKFKSEKGFTGIDIIVAVIIITLFVSIISVVFYNITITAKSSERKTESTYLATSIIEEIKSKEYDDIITTDGFVDINNYKSDNNKILTTTVSTGYTAELKVEIYNPENLENDVVKTISVVVKYKIGKETQSVELKTTIVREV